MANPINDVGSYQHRIIIEEPATAQSPSGQVNRNNAWTEFGRRWASITPLTGREYVYVNQVASEFAHRIEFRYLPGFHSKMRIRLGERIFQISKPPEDAGMNQRKHSVECIEVGV